jgi:hypothetical protein
MPLVIFGKLPAYVPDMLVILLVANIVCGRLSATWAWMTSGPFATFLIVVLDKVRIDREWK